MRPVGGIGGREGSGAARQGPGREQEADDIGGWRLDPTTIRAALEDRGFDVVDDNMGGGQGGIGSVSGRRERGAQVTAVVIDAAGRVRSEVSVVRGERAWSEEIAGVECRAVVETRRTATITGSGPDVGQLAAILAALDRLGATLGDDGGGGNGGDRGSPGPDA